MAKGNLKKRGFMLARVRHASSLSSHNALSGGKRQAACVRWLSVNLRGATLKIPGNWQTVVLPGHDRQDGCRLRLTRPHVSPLCGMCGAAAAVGLQDTQPRGYDLQVSLAAASAPPKHTRSSTPTLGASAGRARREWKGAGPRTAAGASWRDGWWTEAGAGWRSNWRGGMSTWMGTGQGISWWMGVKGRVRGKQRLTRVAVRDPAATRLELPGLAPRQWRGPSMAATGKSAAALFAKQLARAEREQREQKQVEKQKADNDPAAWAATVEDSKRAQEAAQEQRRQAMMKVFEETAVAQVEVDKLSAQLTRLGLQQETLRDHTLDEVGMMLAKAGMKIAGGGNKGEHRAVLRYHLLHGIVNIRSDDPHLVLETRVLPVKEILEIRKGSVVLIVTMPPGTQYTNNQVVAAMQEFGEKVKMADVTSRSTAVSKKLTAGGLTGKLFPPTVEIRLKGEGGVQAPTLAAIRARTMEIKTGDGNVLHGKVTVRSMYALEIHFNQQERSKLKVMWDILELLGLEVEGLNYLLTIGIRRSLEMVGLADGLMCVRMMEERRFGDRVESILTSDIDKTPQHGGPPVLAYFSTKQTRDRVESQGALVTCWLGLAERDCLVLGCGQIEQVALAQEQEVGLAAACKRLVQRAEIYCSNYEQLLASTEALLDRASAREFTQEQLADKMLELFVSKECMRGFDITADFVAGEVKEISITLQVPKNAEEYDGIIQRFRGRLATAKEEIRRRRNLLGPITLIRLPSLTSPAIPRRDKKPVLGKVFDREAVTTVVQEWLRTSLAMEGKEFLLAQPVFGNKDRNHTFWDLGAGAVVAVQHLNQLTAGKVFDDSGGWQGAGVIPEHREAGTRETISVTVTTSNKGTLGTLKIVGVPVKDKLQPVMVASAEMLTAIQRIINMQEGLWVPKFTHDEAEGKRLVIFTPTGGERITRLSELQKPSPDQLFHVGNLHVHAGVSAEACDRALEVLMQLRQAGEIQAVQVNEESLLFLPTPYAMDAAIHIREGGAEALVVGGSVRDWCIGAAVHIFLGRVRRVVGDGLWFPFRMHNEDRILDRCLKVVEGPQVERWYDTIRSIQETALCRTKDTTKIAAAFKSQARNEWPRLVVYTVGEDYSVVVFSNSVYSKMLKTQPIRVGLPLSATFSSVPDTALMSFYHWLCGEAHNRFINWRAHEGQVGEGSRGVVFQHDSTFRALEQQRIEGRGNLSLTLPQAQELHKAQVSRNLESRPILTASGSDVYYTPESAIVGLWVINQAKPEAEESPLDQCHIEWSNHFRPHGGDTGSGWPKGDTLLAIISEQWPELRHGRIVTGMITTLHKRNLLAVLEAKAGFMIVPPQMVSQGQAATLEQQFGASGDDLTFLDNLEVLIPSMFLHGNTMERLVNDKSVTTLHVAVTKLCKQIFVLPGVQVLAQEGMYDESEGEKLFGHNVLDGRLLPTKPENVHTSIHINSLGSHPAIRDWRGLFRLLLWIARQKEDLRPRMIPVGNNGTSILFIPRTTTESFLTWDFNDPRFRQWQLDGPDPLERLRQSKRGEDVGNREKNKASGTARGRDDEDSTLEQGKRSKGQPQAGAHQLPGNDASGGGSTSEDMNE
jgi:hypothetical protein